MDGLFHVFCCDWLTSFILAGLVVLLAYIYGTWTYSTWTQAGIPGPKPQPFIGNLGEFRKMGSYNMGLQWSKKYGKTFGVYFMRRSMLWTTDLDILKEVFIKEFNNFPERSINPLTPYPLNLGLVFLNGDHQWRRLRHALTPTFSSGKLKMMGRFISRCCDNLAGAIGKSADAGEQLDVKRTFGSFSLDVIAGTGFGFETNSLTDEESVFLYHAKEVFGGANHFKLVVALGFLIPSLAPVLRALGFSTNPKKNVDFLTETIRAVIEERKRGEKASQDFIQLMLDAEASDEEVAKEPDKKHLTKDELVAQALLFFVAGYDTTSTTLQFLSYLLAINPDKQDKLHQEIVDGLGDAQPTYENVMSIPYLEACIYETLRMYPPIPMMNRKCVKETTVQGVTIAAGSGVGANIIGLMFDEDIFPRPQLFLPERYLDEEHPIPQLAKDFVFGAGPRQCIGMRLALYEIKMAAVTLLRKFRFVKVEDTPAEITLSPAAMTMSSKPIYIGAQRR